MTQIGPLGEKALECRGISVETAVRYGVFTGRSVGGDKVVPDPTGNVIAFPYREHGNVVAEKYRASGKKFWQRAGGRKTFWNSDALDDPALEDGRMPLIIAEGEVDALTAIDCGFPLSVSVPDGAPSVKPNEDPDVVPDNAGQSDHSGKFEFLYNNRDRLKRAKRFILAVDNDAPGLAAELLRRLSASRCSFVTYPEGCKDLSDVRQQLGIDAVVSVLNAAKPYPVRGLYRFSDYPYAGPLPVYSTGWMTLDPLVKLFPGAFVVVSGIPAHGKSTWVLNLLVNLAELHGWRSAIYSPEMPVVPQMRDKLRRIVARKGLQGIGDGELGNIDRWLDDVFVFIDGEQDSESDCELNLDWVLDKATDAIMRDGIKVLVIDPWNELEHARRRDESQTEYVGRAIRAIKRFARRYQVVTMVVAHPTKDVAKDGKARRPTLYDIESSAHWHNKADIGIIIDWPDRTVRESIIEVKKVRFEEVGEKGEVRLKFDRYSSRYDLLDAISVSGNLI